MLYKRDVCCINIKVLIEYLKKNYNVNLNDLFKNIDLKKHQINNPLDYFSDINNWISSSIVKIIFKNASLLTTDEDLLYKVGYNSILEKRLGYIQKIIFLSLGDPKIGIKKSNALNNKFNKTKKLEIEYLGRNKGIILLKWFKDLELSKDFCNINKGIYTAIPTIFNLPPANLIERKCFFKGDPYCEYHAEWKTHNIIKDVFFKIFTKRKILEEALNELELDKSLIQKKYV